MSYLQWLSSSGLRHWKSEILDWLCIRCDLDRSITGLRLLHEPHHQFVELYIYNKNGQLLEALQIEGQAAFEFSISKHPGSVLLAKAQFHPYARPPFFPNETVGVVCAELLRGAAREEIPVQICDSPEILQRTRSAPASDLEVLLDLVLLPERTFTPELRAEPAASAHPFRLSVRFKRPVRVFLLDEKMFAAGISPETRVDWTKLAPFGAPVRIEPDQYWSRDPLPDRDWLIALPVLEVSNTIGLIGRPFARKPLISDLTLTTRGGRMVQASWTWKVRARWLQVGLAWDFFSQDQWDGNVQEVIVPRQTFDAKGMYQLFEHASAPPNRSLYLTAKPIVFNSPVDGQELSDFQEL